MQGTGSSSTGPSNANCAIGADGGGCRGGFALRMRRMAQGHVGRAGSGLNTRIIPPRDVITFAQLCVAALSRASYSAQPMFGNVIAP